MVYPIARRVIPLFAKRFIREVNGLENTPKDRNFIIAANHASYMDHFIIFSIMMPYLSKRIHYLAKKEHFQSIHQKLWHRYAQAIPIDRSAGQNALNKAVDYIKNNKIIAIYPEGTRTLTGELQKAKTGIARLVLAAKVPVLPIGLIGTFGILPKGKYIPKLKKATMNIGKLITFDEYYNKKITKSLLRKITDEIMQEIAKLSNQKYNF